MNRDNRKTAKMLVGYSSDSHLQKKCRAIEYKFSEKTGYNLNIVLEEAEKFYQTKKEFIFNNN